MNLFLKPLALVHTLRRSELGGASENENMLEIDGGAPLINDCLR